MAYKLIIESGHCIDCEGDWQLFKDSGHYYYKIYINPKAVYHLTPLGKLKIDFDPDDHCYLVANRYREVYSLVLIIGNNDVDYRIGISDDETLNEAEVEFPDGNKIV